MTIPTRIGGAILTNVSELVLTNLSADYIKYKLIFSGLVAVSDTQTNLVIRTSTNNGTSFTSSSNAYAIRLQRSSGTDSRTINYVVFSTMAQAVNAVSNTSGNFISGTIEIFEPVNANVSTIFLTRSNGRVNADSDASNPQVQDVWARREAQESNNAIGIFAISDAAVASNFSMQYVLYGYEA